MRLPSSGTKLLGKEYQKKMAEAQAKGDIQAVTKLAQEMQQKVGQMQVQAIEGNKGALKSRVAPSRKGHIIQDRSVQRRRPAPRTDGSN